jgi:hypothetical protein
VVCGRTLSRREADLIERKLAGDSELARRYDLVRQELAETIQLNETLGAPSGRAMEKLFAAIDAEEAGAPRRRRRRISRTPLLTTTSTLNNDASGAGKNGASRGGLGAGPFSMTPPSRTP